MKSLFQRLLYCFFLAVIIGAIIYAWPRLPIITAFAAKGMCLCVFITDRSTELLYKQEIFPWPKGDQLRDTMIPGLDYKKLVVVRMGYSLENLDMNEFLSNIIAALP